MQRQDLQPRIGQRLFDRRDDGVFQHAEDLGKLASRFQLDVYGFDKELAREFAFTERYPRQPEILRYLELVADKHDLRRNIAFNTKVEGATFDEDSDTWVVRTADGQSVRCRVLIGAVGSLSVPNTPPAPARSPPARCSA